MSPLAWLQVREAEIAYRDSRQTLHLETAYFAHLAYLPVSPLIKLHSEHGRGVSRVVPHLYDRRRDRLYFVAVYHHLAGQLFHSLEPDLSVDLDIVYLRHRVARVSQLVRELAVVCQ